MTNEAKRARLDRELARAKSKVNKRRAELREKALERRKKEFDKLPQKQREIREAIGWSPYQDGKVIRRECGAIKAV